MKKGVIGYILLVDSETPEQDLGVLSLRVLIEVTFVIQLAPKVLYNSAMTEVQGRRVL